MDKDRQAEEAKKVNDEKESTEPKTMPAAADLPHGIIEIYFYKTEEVDIDYILEKSAEFCVEAEIGSKMLIDGPHNDKHFKTYNVALVGASTQGLIIDVVKNPEPDMPTVRMCIPHLASPHDVSLAFTIMDGIKHFSPDCVIWCETKSQKGQIDTSDESHDTVIACCFENMEHMIKHNDGDGNIAVNGFKRQYFLPKPQKDKKPLDMVVEAMHQFIDVQWNYDSYAEAYVNDDYEEDGTPLTGAFIGCNKAVFVPIFNRIVVKRENDDNKIATREAFLAVAEKLPQFKWVDAAQFVLDKMSDEEWEAFWQSIEGDVVKASDIPQPNTFIFRWNPQISSFTLDDYRKKRKAHADEFYLNWSVWDWENAKEGDNYVMMRVDDANPGIAFHGFIESDPYEGENWSGKGNTVHYVDISCLESTPPSRKPILTLDELAAAMPEVDWLHGHSGELLTPDQSRKLRKLIDKAIGR